MAKVMKFPGPAIIPNSLRNVASPAGQIIGYQFQIRLRYYRGHFLSCTEELTLQVDGQPVAPLQMSFGINGKDLPVEILPELIAEFWQVTEPATLYVSQLGGLSAGEHDLDLRLMMRLPYMPNFDLSTPNRYVQLDNCDAGRFTVGLPG